MLFDLAGKCLATSQRELTQYYPEPGHVEHDAGEIWDKTLACAQALVERAGGADRIAALGIANQRETVVAWRSEEHTSELQSLMRNSYAVFCLKKKKQQDTHLHTIQQRKRSHHKYNR